MFISCSFIAYVVEVIYNYADLLANEGFRCIYACLSGDCEAEYQRHIGAWFSIEEAAEVTRSQILVVVVKNVFAMFLFISVLIV